MTIGPHISRKFDQELEDVRHRVLAMGGLVEQQIQDALKALMEGDGQLAEFVLTKDHQINAMEVSIDEECVHILAKRQPAAIDLRFVFAVIKTITDLERIGDEAERIARMALHLIDNGCRGDNCPGLEGIESMAGRVEKMLHEVLDALARLDAESALHVAQEDLKVNKEYKAITRQIVTFMMEDPRTISRGIDMLWVARALERIGDHARNIGEYIIYLVKGKDVRHTTLEQMEKAVHEEKG